MLIKRWLNASQILVKPWSYSDQMLIKPRSNVDQMLVKCKSGAGQTLVTRWSNANHMLVKYKSSAGQTLDTRKSHAGHTLPSAGLPARLALSPRRLLRYVREPAARPRRPHGHGVLWSRPMPAHRHTNTAEAGCRGHAALAPLRDRRRDASAERGPGPGHAEPARAGQKRVCARAQRLFSGQANKPSIGENMVKVCCSLYSMAEPGDMRIKGILVLSS